MKNDDCILSEYEQNQILNAIDVDGLDFFPDELTDFGDGKLGVIIDEDQLDFSEKHPVAQQLLDAATSPHTIECICNTASAVASATINALMKQLFKG